MMTDAPIALLLTGRGRYADPWHPFDRTSPQLAELAREVGFVVVQPDDVETALADLETGALALPDLVIADLGRPRDDLPSPEAPLATAGLDLLVSSRPLLAVHAAANTFPDSTSWADAVGGRWVPGTSWHPPQNEFTAIPAPDLAQPFDSLAPFTVTDERYLDLIATHGAERRELYRHVDDDGRLQPAVWVQERDGVRSAYDALGHDEESYRSEGHRTLVRTILRWLLTGRSAHPGSPG
jgi:hypothetical protein